LHAIWLDDDQRAFTWHTAKATAKRADFESSLLQV
jgi:hypothetical protein